MQFLKDFLFNLILYAAMFLVLYLISPELMAGVYQIGYKLLGPWLIVLIILSATIPWKRLRRR